MVDFSAEEVFCRLNCTYLVQQKDAMLSNPVDEIPKLMCPRVAATVVRALALEISEPSDEPSVIDLGLAAEAAERYDLKARRCAQNIIRKGTDTVTLQEVQSITSEEIIDLVVSIGADPPQE